MKLLQDRLLLEELPIEKGVIILDSYRPDYRVLQIGVGVKKVKIGDKVRLWEYHHAVPYEGKLIAKEGSDVELVL